MTRRRSVSILALVLAISLPHPGKAQETQICHVQAIQKDRISDEDHAGYYGFLSWNEFHSPLLTTRGHRTQNLDAQDFFGKYARFIGNRNSTLELSIESRDPPLPVPNSYLITVKDLSTKNQRVALKLHGTGCLQIYSAYLKRNHSQDSRAQWHPLASGLLHFIELYNPQ